MRESASFSSAMSRRRFLQVSGSAASGAALAALLGGCGNSNGGTASAKIAVTGWPDFLYGLPWGVAKHAGLFQESGVRLEGIIGSSGGGTTVRSVVTGDLPLGQVALPAAIQAFQAGAPLKIIAGAIQNNADISYVTRPDSNINGIDDLRGKTIGFTNPGSTTHAEALLALESAGIDPGEVRLQPTGGVPEGLTLLEKGAIDAAPSFLPLPLDPWKVVFNITEYVPDFLGSVLIAGGGVIEDDSELIGSLVETFRRGIETTSSDLNAAISAWTKDSEVSKSAATEAMRAIDRQDFYGTQLSIEGLQKAVHAMKLTDTLTEPVDWKAILDQRFLTDAERVDGSALNG